MTTTHDLLDFFEKYDISENYGFLSNPCEFVHSLPDGFEEFQDVYNNLDSLDGLKFRELVDGLAVGKPQSHYYELAIGLSTAQKKQVYTIFTFIAQKYVRCMGACKPPSRWNNVLNFLGYKNTKQEQEQVQSIPYEIGIIWYVCAQEFNLPTVTSYSAVILNNCKLNENTGEIESVYQISGTSDELHFYKVHMAIEMAGAKILPQMFYPEESTKRENIVTLLNDVSHTIKELTNILNTMYDGCDPEIFWKNVRIFLGGYTESNGLPNGLYVRGSEIGPFKFVGGSAAQSTLIQALDIFLDVEHYSEHGKKFLFDQRSYMPAKHVNYLNDLHDVYKTRKLRNIVEEYDDEDVTSAYNDALEKLRLFRLAHFQLVHKYVIKFVTKLDPKVDIATNTNGKAGTGGLPTEQLKEFIVDTNVSKTGDNYKMERTMRKLLFSDKSRDLLNWKHVFWLWPLSIVCWQIYKRL